jgi:transglutaminase-like putative cysteine protease
LQLRLSFGNVSHASFLQSGWNILELVEAFEDYIHDMVDDIFIMSYDLNGSVTVIPLFENWCAFHSSILVSSDRALRRFGLDVL